MADYKKIFLFVILTVMFSFMLQQNLPFVKEKKLHGAFTVDSLPDFSWENYFSCSYQLKTDSAVNDHIGFSKTLRRLNNQYDYALKKFNVQELLQGKNGEFFNNYFAQNYLGTNFNSKRFDTTYSVFKKFVDILRSKGKHVLVVIAPCKSSYMPENLPENYLKNKKNTSYYTAYKAYFDSDKLNYFDAHEYFQKLKDTCKAPLFNETGVHWASYGARLVCDTMTKIIGKLFNHKLTEYITEGVEWSNSPRSDDNDIGKALNLLINPPQKKLAYHKYLRRESPDTVKPKVIFVTDSYFFQIDDGYWTLEQQLSKNSWHWYYFNSAFKYDHSPFTNVYAIDVVNEIENTDIVVFLGSIGTMEKFPYTLPSYYNRKINSM